MLPIEQRGTRGPLVVLTHWLGGSSRTWTEVSENLAEAGYRCVAADLPGFGRARDAEDFSIAAMTQQLIETICVLRQGEHGNFGAQGAPWFLAGHSMGGKLALLVAHAAQQGEQGLENLRGVVLVSPSPPSPEPVAESTREKNIHSLGPDTRAPEERRKHAEAFLDAGTGKLALLDAVRQRSVDDLLLMNPDAMAAWMTEGSKVDSSESVGVLNVPALILAGTEEPELGPEAQEKLTRPHFAVANVVALEGSGHLSPLERPWEVSDRMLEFFQSFELPKSPAAAGLSANFAGLINSARTSPQTRNALLQRMQQDTNSGSQPAGILNADERRTLRALAAQVIPEAGFDLAARMEQMLARNQPDGWRFAALPEDAKAWKQGLASLDAAALRDNGVPFVALDASRQEHLLQRAQGGDLGKGLLASVGLGASAHVFSAQQMRDWFEDVRGEFAKLYVADPRTMERIGFTGFADEAGFINITLEQQTNEVAS